MGAENILIILNPIAGAGKARARWPILAKILNSGYGIRYDMMETRYRGHAIHLAEQASDHGIRLIVAIGGDGTINEVVNGLVKGSPGRHLTTELGIINCGTGSGFAQSIGLPSGLEEQLAVILEGRGNLVDIGLLECAGPDGTKIRRSFISECQAGVSGKIVANVGRGKKKLGGKWAFGLQTVSDLLRYKSTQISLTIDKQVYPGKKMLGLVIGNGKYCAGGMQLTPEAKLDDGFLDLLIMSEMGFMDRLRSFPKVYRGKHIEDPFFELRRVKSLEVLSDEPILVEADGELIGKTPFKLNLYGTIKVRH